MHPWHDTYVDDTHVEKAFPVIVEIPNGSKNKYEVDSFTLNGSTIVVAIKGGGKVDAADQDDARADLHAAKVLKMPLSTWLKPLKLDLAFP